MPKHEWRGLKVLTQPGHAVCKVQWAWEAQARFGNGYD